MITGNEQAFPIYDKYYKGLTIREHFASMAVQGLCATLNGNEKVSSLAPLAVSIADALIAELNKPQPND